MKKTKILTIKDMDEFITDNDVKGFINGIMEIIPFKEFSDYDEMMKNVIELAKSTNTKLSESDENFIFTILVNLDQYPEFELQDY